MHTATLLRCSLVVSHASADMADGFCVKAVCQLVWSTPIGSDTDGTDIFTVLFPEPHLLHFSGIENWGTGPCARRHERVLVHKHIYILPLV